MHISTLDGLIQALQELKTRCYMPGDTPVVMGGGMDVKSGKQLAVPVAVSTGNMTKTAPKRLSSTGGTPCVFIGRSR